MATVQLQGELGRAFKVGQPHAGAWAGHITMASGAELQVPLPQRYLEMNAEEIALAIARAKERLGSRLVILGHHYQREEVIRWADFRGDSFKLCKDAAARPDAEYIIFCGVHFM